MVVTIEPCIETHSGRQFDLLDPRPDNVFIGDIAHSLALQCRYTGHTAKFYSIAEHCVHCADLLRMNGQGVRLQFLALMHDAGEAYFGDFATPVKQLIPQIRELDKTIQAVVWRACGVRPPTEQEHTTMKEADHILLMTEAEALIPSGGAEWHFDADPDDRIEIQCWEWREAKAKFQTRYEDLRRELAAQETA